MNRNVIVYDGETGRGMNYSISPGENRFNGYVKDNKGRQFLFVDSDEDYEYVRTIPTYRTTTNINRSGVRKPSIYKRPFLQCRREEYKHAFTNVIRKTVQETHDVYLNSRRNRFVDKVSTKTWFNDDYSFVY